MSPTRIHWLRRRATIRKLWMVGCIVLALLVLAQALIEVKGHFGLDGTFGFNAWYGFATCVAMVVFAKGLGVFLKRKDTYYDRD
jgi:hypothetical protein